MRVAVGESDSHMESDSFATPSKRISNENWRNEYVSNDCDSLSYCTDRITKSGVG